VLAQQFISSTDAQCIFDPAALQLGLGLGLASLAPLAAVDLKVGFKGLPFAWHRSAVVMLIAWDVLVLPTWHRTPVLDPLPTASAVFRSIVMLPEKTLYYKKKWFC
jgi:hypothetical protein